MQPDGHHLAQINIGRLVAEPDDPRVAEFMGAVEQINGLGKRMPGFVWIMEGPGGLGNTETKLAGDPRFISNLTVWENVERLEHFVWNTLHRQVYERRAEWFEVLGEMHFAMWWVPEGHQPSLEEGMARLEHLRAHGDSDHAFGWAWLNEARLWRDKRCGAVAAE